MGGLSWNPTSWTPSNLAEEAVEFVTGSEAAGDVAGLAAAWLTGDAMGIASQAGDLGQNLLAGGKSLLEGFGKAAQDAFKEFSNPGAVKSPNQSECKCGGYTPGEATGPEDTGPIGKPPTTEPGAGGVGIEATGDPALDAILRGGGSLEDMIFALMMHLQKEKKGQIGKSISKVAAGSKEANAAQAAATDGKDGANAGKLQEKASNLSAEKDAALQTLQRETGDLAQLTQLTTGLMDSFKKMKDSVIQNIR